MTGQVWTLWAGAAAACGLAALTLLALWLMGGWRRRQQQQRLAQAVQTRLHSVPATGPLAENAMPSPPRQAVEELKNRAGLMGARWLQGRFGNSLLGEQDRQLINSAGFENAESARQYFALCRVGLSVALILIFSFLPLTRSLNTLVPFLTVFLGFALGWMLPKWVLLRRAARRRAQMAAELPLFVDLLRLLQGVGLSMDQTLYTIERDFKDALPVMSSELSVAIEQHARGRTREQSLERIATGFDNEDLAVICRLIVQVDQHGGAMQEPLQRFGTRLRDQRRLEMKETVGKLTVKMTGVMVLTLLPALLIVTAGSGFLALFRGLSRVAGG
ncbi:type II secretion system F family protein [Alcaligenes sp. SDU_A2]|uniref:type II secretion system F family protein n=1 Tax=Alcaligenes sp. SDU_A2 TaxID=3136634 RepID=UPI00311E95B9